jgi:hypothetical protein
MLQYKTFILEMEPSFNLALAQVLPTYTQKQIDEKVKALEDILSLEIAASISTHPYYARHNRFYISTNVLRRELKQYERKKAGIKKSRIFDLIQATCPVIQEDKTLDTYSGVMGHKVLAMLTKYVNFTKLSNTELARKLSYEEQAMEEEFEYLTEELFEYQDDEMAAIFKCKGELRYHKSQQMIERMYYDCVLGDYSDYEFIRINHASLRAYHEYHLGPGTKKKYGRKIREQIDKNLAIIPIMLQIGEYFKAKFPDKHTGKHPDYTDYGWLPVKSSKSKFGRTYYKSPISMLDPQSMNKKLRAAALGDNTTYDYDMRSFAATWMYGEVNKLVPEAEKEFPISYMIASGRRKSLFKYLREEIFGDRIQTIDAMQTIYDSHADWIYFDGDALINSIKSPVIDNEGNETGKYFRTTDLHVTEDRANRILKGCFQAISFGAKPNTNTWCIERVHKKTGKKSLSFRSTAFMELFHGDEALTIKFLENEAVQMYLSEINRTTDLLLEHNAEAIAHLKADEDFIYDNGKWKNSNVMAYLYQHAEWDVMESVRALITYYNETQGEDVFVIASIHDGLVLNKADPLLIDFIHEHIRKYYGNPHFTLVGEAMKGYQNDHFVKTNLSEHQKIMAEQEEKAQSYVPTYITVGEKTQREIEQEHVDAIEQSMMDFFAYQDALDQEDEKPKARLVPLPIERQLEDI